jgi:hypothetical protein
MEWAALQDENAIATDAARALQQQFAHVSADEIDALVRQQVHLRFESARVKAFVGVLAVRSARAEINRLLREQSAAACATDPPDLAAGTRVDSGAPSQSLIAPQLHLH